tara:strand:- start:3081 stop:4418 length:1338 start_codon:yes stop_codon:yes gene_type:complete
MFVDEAKIYVKGGDGGKGCQSFAKTTKKAFRGPDGGNGGQGGNVVFCVDHNLNSLQYFRFRKHHKADPGVAGDRRKDGRGAKDLVIKVPRGTCVFDENNNLIADLNREGQQYVAAKGGRGGRGNRSLITSTNTCPRYAEKGEPGEELWIRLELKLTAEVGIIGFPNVGKSTLIAKMSNAKPKIADYPFTTLVPNLGMVPINDNDSILVADIPGIIEGAHEGQGLGHQFLRHIERTGFLVHMVDLFPYDQQNPWQSYQKVNKELKNYSEILAEKYQVIVLNKMDMPGAEEARKKFMENVEKSGENLQVISLSALTGEGTSDLVRRLAEYHTLHPARDQIFELQVKHRERRELAVEALTDGFKVTGDIIERHVAMTDFQNEEAMRTLHKFFESSGLISILKKKGAAEGDQIYVGEQVLDFIDDAYDSPFLSEEEVQEHIWTKKQKED